MATRSAFHAQPQMILAPRCGKLHSGAYFTGAIYMAGFAYYNEYDPFASQWLIQLIGAGLIAPGIVDSRSIEDGRPSDLKGFTQCHFFAGIGVWSLAARLAGWPDDTPLWTGSCPCQPFSQAGKGNGFADERHLWPAFHYLIEQCRPAIVAGEQVASPDGLTWLDLVQTDMEGQGYAFGAADTCAAGFGAPHIRQRLYWVADDDARLERRWQSGRERPDQFAAWQSGLVERLAYPYGTGSFPSTQSGIYSGENGTGSRYVEPQRSGGVGGMANMYEVGHSAIQRTSVNRLLNDRKIYRERLQHECSNPISNRIPLYSLDYWRDAEWLLCRDPDGARFRPVEPGTFPLVDARTLRNRLDTVRGAGNALNLAQAQAWMTAIK